MLSDWQGQLPARPSTPDIPHRVLRLPAGEIGEAMRVCVFVVNLGPGSRIEFVDAVDSLV